MERPEGSGSRSEEGGEVVKRRGKGQKTSSGGCFKKIDGDRVFRKKCSIKGLEKKDKGREKGKRRGGETSHHPTNSR